VVEDQPPVSEDQQPPSPTPKQELQQLQAQLQSMQQERDRVAAAFTANQWAAQASTQAAEIWQQLAILQAKIQSMQPSQSNLNTSNQPHLANQSQPNPPPRSIIQPAYSTPYTSPHPHRTIDPKSPLSEGIQNSLWPPSYKPITLPKFSGRKDPR
jgi:hypothetical protein